MSFFLMKLKVVNLLCIIIETTDEEEKKHFLNTFYKNEKSILDDRVFKLHDYKFKNGKLINGKN